MMEEPLEYQLLAELHWLLNRFYELSKEGKNAHIEYKDILEVVREIYRNSKLKRELAYDIEGYRSQNEEIDREMRALQEDLRHEHQKYKREEELNTRLRAQATLKDAEITRLNGLVNFVSDQCNQLENEIERLNAVVRQLVHCRVL